MLSHSQTQHTKLHSLSHEPKRMAVSALKSSLQMCLHKIPAMEELDKKVTKANVDEKQQLPTTF